MLRFGVFQRTALLGNSLGPCFFLWAGHSHSPQSGLDRNTFRIFLFKTMKASLYCTVTSQLYINPDAPLKVVYYDNKHLDFLSTAHNMATSQPATFLPKHCIFIANTWLILDFLHIAPLNAQFLNMGFVCLSIDWPLNNALILVRHFCKLANLHNYTFGNMSFILKCIYSHLI